MKIKMSELNWGHTGSLVRLETARGEVHYSYLSVVLDSSEEERYRLIGLVGLPFFGFSLDAEIEIVRERRAPSRVGALIRIDDRTYRREEGENYPWLSDIGYSYRDGEIAKMIDDCYLYEVVSDEDR